MEREFVMNLKGEFPFDDPRLRIDNTRLSPYEAAMQIASAFHLGQNDQL
jgi:hypothetical protein